MSGVDELAKGGRVQRGLRGGAVAGLVAGLVFEAFRVLTALLMLVIVRLIVASAQIGPIWIPLKMSAYPLLGERALRPGFDALGLLLGLLVHLATSVAWGALFGLVAYGLSRVATVGLGALWGVLVWAVMIRGLTPLLGSEELSRLGSALTTIVGHVLFGVVLGIAFLPHQRGREGRALGWRRIGAPPRGAAG